MPYNSPMTVFLHPFRIFIAVVLLPALATLSGCDRNAPATDPATQWEFGEQTPAASESEALSSYVFDVSVDSVEELETILERAAELSDRPRPRQSPPEIVLVLHGQEIRYFDIANYEQHKRVVDLAARLDAFNIIDIRMCQSRLSTLGLERGDVPAFIELVPFGPGEVERLRKQGSVVL